MKYLFSLSLFLLVISCKEKPLDVETAKKVAETLISKADKGDWENIADLYTAEFNASETPDVKTQKLMRLNEALGKVKSVEFLSSTDVAEFGRPREMVLKYRVIHERVTSIEIFTIQEDEGGYKVSAHSVESEK